MSPTIAPLENGPRQRQIKLGNKGLKQLSRRARWLLRASPHSRDDGRHLWVRWEDYHAVQRQHPKRLLREWFFLPLGWIMRHVGFARPGDTVSRLAKPIARALRLSCIDPATRQLRPGSPCARVEAKMNRAG
jgi:hypothetical protein